MTHRTPTLALAAASVLAVATPSLHATEILRVIRGIDEACGLGNKVSAFSDVTGDGVPDLLLSASGVPSEGCPGAVILCDGATGALVWSHRAVDSDRGLGSRLARLGGDVDGDGYEDFAAGVPSGATQDSRQPVGVVEVLSGRTGQTIWRFSIADADDRFGSAMTAAGDVNGDNVPDLLMGEPDFASPILSGQNRAVVISGADGSILETFGAMNPGERFGASVALAGDVDGDSVPDFLIGATEAGTDIAPLSGAIYVMSGATGAVLSTLRGDSLEHIGASVALAGDVDGDGWPEVAALGDGVAVVFRLLDGSVLYRWSVPGAFSLATGQDVTGDGTPDVVVGDPSGGDQGMGEVTIYSGRDGALAMTLNVWDIGGGSGTALLGRSVALISDIDGDGAAEIVAGAPLAQAPRGRRFQGVAVIASLENEITLRCGNVNRGRGPAADVLYVNDGKGDLRRELRIARYEPVTAFVSAPPAAAGRAPYALFARLGAPTAGSLTELPSGIGVACFPMPLSGSGPIRGTWVLDNTLPEGSFRDSIGAPLFDAEPAPATALRLPHGTRRPVTFTLQGVIEDAGSSGAAGLSLTNAIVLISN